MTMELESLIDILSSHFEIIDFRLPTGTIIQCVQEETVLIPLAKVYIYGTGKVQFSNTEQQELNRLKQERKMDQKAFNSSEKKELLRQLMRRQENWSKSQNNLYALSKVELSDSAVDIRKIISHLIETGKQTLVDTSTSGMIRSVLDTPSGPLTIRTGWRLIDDSLRYLTTIHFLPPKNIDETSTE